ncbi:hypothetical protein DAETH_14630 [Deinococcus aetherius]|uniref:Lipoprotein n=2 Tax=Deinococcus aetherius TaxID=200252 RepID=A0ABM8ACK0_9DEIO|nr:hypothetical protein DAETH_14630 [Deinococcus aetherius]
MGLAAVLLLALPLGGCGLLGIPRPVTLGVVNVTLPATVSPTAPMQVDVRVGMGSCEDTNHRLTLVSRTAQTLTLKAEATKTNYGAVCPAVYTESTLSYTDPGTPTRTSPFEVIVNGKSWGKVEVR